MTNDTTKQIKNYILMRGGYCRRVNVIGYKNRKQDAIGHPDLDCMINGNGFKVEIKSEYDKGKDKLSPEQKKFILDYEIAGGKVFIAKDLKDFQMQFSDWYKTKPYR